MSIANCTVFFSRVDGLCDLAFYSGKLRAISVTFGTDISATSGQQNLTENSPKLLKIRFMFCS